MQTGFQLGRVGEAVLVCVSAYAALGLSQSSATHRKIFCEVRQRLGNLREGNYRRTCATLARKGLIRCSAGAALLTAAGKKALGLKGGAGGKVSVPDRRSWDGLWRVVSFDVRRRKQRDLLREGLKAIGFRFVHQSVWVHPGDCRRQVENLVAALGADRNVHFLVVSKFDSDSAARKIFKM